MNGFCRAIGLYGASLSILAFAQTAGAQTSPAQSGGQSPPAPTSATSVVGLPEVIVTARRRVENLQNVPVAATALSKATLERYNVESLQSIASLTPQLNIATTPTGAGAQFTLRGIGSSSTSVGIEQSVATVVDGVYYGSGRIVNEAMFDLDRVEILKGPQALFFGKNATAGVISITTADPTTTPEFILRSGYETTSEQVYGEAVASGPITDTLGIRAAFHIDNMFGGYVTNRASPYTLTTTDVVTGATGTQVVPAGPRETPGDRNIMGRVTLKWRPNSNLTSTLKLNGDDYRANNPAWTNTVFNCPGGVSQLGGSPCNRDFDIYQNPLPSAIAAVTPFFDKNGGQFQRYVDLGVTDNTDYRMPFATLTEIINYQRNLNEFGEDADYETGPSADVWAAEQSIWHAFSNETRLQTTFSGPVNLLGGFYYQQTHRTNSLLALLSGLEDSAAPSGDRYVGFYNRSDTAGNTYSGFAQVSWKPTSQIEVTAGARYTHETADSFFFRPYVNPALISIFATTRYDVDQSFNNVSPEATISYRPLSYLTVYAAYKTGYKSGGFSNSANLTTFGSISDLAFNPERAKGYEGGIKSTLFDNQLRLNVDAYNYDYVHLQVDFYNSPTLSFITTNAGSAQTRGFDSDFEYGPRSLPGFDLHGSLNYNDAEYTNYQAPCYAGETPAQGCTLTVFGGLPGQNLSGTPLSVAPKWTAALGASYDRDLGSGFKAGISTDARYSDTYLASSFGNPYSRQPAYISLDATARVRTTDGRWELAVIGRNLTNQFIINSSIDGTGTGGGTGTAAGVHADEYGFISLPRTIQLQLTWRH